MPMLDIFGILQTKEKNLDRFQENSTIYCFIYYLSISLSSQTMILTVFIPKLNSSFKVLHKQLIPPPTSGSLCPLMHPTVSCILTVPWATLAVDAFFLLQKRGCPLLTIQNHPYVKSSLPFPVLVSYSEL